jgi:hypothetical protein
MADSGIHSVVVSIVKVFKDDDLIGASGIPLSEKLFLEVDNKREFDVKRVEIVTNGRDNFSFSGKIYDSLPRFDQIIALSDFQAILEQSMSASSFDSWVEVRLSVTYPISELKEFLDAADDDGLENSNIFTWIDYCIDDASEVILEDIGKSPDLKPLLTIRGLWPKN